MAHVAIVGGLESVSPESSRTCHSTYIRWLDRQRTCKVASDGGANVHTRNNEKRDLR